ncbi:MAG: peptidylprolyl isomerase [Kiritimatiellaeota bacterium]|nr:peptidylprolyl isomerase [Kiritimatiellota bacterium]
MKNIPRAASRIAKLAAAGLVLSALPGCDKANGEAPETAQKETDPKAAALICNGDILTFGELDEVAGMQLKGIVESGEVGMEEKNREEALRQIREDYARMFLQKTLLRQESQKRDLSVTDEDFKSELAIIEEMAKGKGMTFDEWVESIPMPRDLIMGEIRDQILIKKLIAHIQDNITVSDGEITAMKGRSAAALDKIKDIKKQLDEGADFAELAMEHSEDPGSGYNGGELGTFDRDKMVKPFGDAAFALEPGAVSDVVTTQLGHHLIKVAARDEEAGTVTASHILIRAAPEMTDEQIVSSIHAQKKQHAITEVFQRIQNEAKVECHIPGLVYSPAMGLVPENGE